MLRNFRLNLFVRLLVIVLLSQLLFYCYLYTGYYIAMSLMACSIVILFMNTIYYVDQTNRDISSFLLGIKYDDFSTTFTSTKRGTSFNLLYDALNQVIGKFRDVRAEGEAHYQYLQTVVKNINTGLLCIDETQQVVLANDAVKRMLHKSHFIHLQTLQQIDSQLYKVVSELEPGERELVKMIVDNKMVQLAVQMTRFKLQGKEYTLFAIQNIQNELEEQELEAWQKLIRILTHEIMNSVAPISSVSSTIGDMMEQDEPLDAEDLIDIKGGIRAIQNRCDGLMQFTETYRNLTRIPPPQFETVSLGDILQGIHTLFKPDLQHYKVNFQLLIPATPISISADPKLLEQVCINLFKNALDAIKEVEKPQLTISMRKIENGKAVIQIGDNGKGISPEVLEQIFVPFYTTKEEGSGIGLSLSRQIMRMHKGNISVRSVVGEGTVVTLIL